jgi:hypothetical protein
MVALGFCLAAVATGAGVVLAQGLSDQQVRCMQLQQELAAARSGGANRDDVAQIDQQIAQQDRIFQGTQAAMEDAGCYQRLFIFGRALVRNPQCLNMNDRVEAARRELAQLHQQRQAMTGGGENRRRQAELQQALARSGCGGVQVPRGGGLFDFFGGGQDDQGNQYTSPTYRSIDPNGRYRSVCVRLCDGFYYPIHFSTYGSRLAQDEQQCQSSCAAPAELYVYRNPGQEIQQAISLNGSAYMDLPVALKYRKEYVKGCSCKQSEYNPTEIEAANKKAELDSEQGKVKGKGKAAPTPQTAVPASQAATAGTPAAGGDQTMPQLDLDITGSTQSTGTPPAETAAETVSPPPAAPKAQALRPSQSTIVKSKPSAAAD